MIPRIEIIQLLDGFEKCIISQRSAITVSRFRYYRVSMEPVFEIYLVTFLLPCIIYWLNSAIIFFVALLFCCEITRQFRFGNRNSTKRTPLSSSWSRFQLCRLFEKTPPDETDPESVSRLLSRLFINV